MTVLCCIAANVENQSSRLLLQQLPQLTEQSIQVETSFPGTQDDEVQADLFSEEQEKPSVWEIDDLKQKLIELESRNEEMRLCINGYKSHSRELIEQLESVKTEKIKIESGLMGAQHVTLESRSVAVQTQTQTCIVREQWTQTDMDTAVPRNTQKDLRSAREEVLGLKQQIGTLEKAVRCVEDNAKSLEHQLRQALDDDADGLRREKKHLLPQMASAVADCDREHGQAGDMDRMKEELETLRRESVEQSAVLMELKDDMQHMISYSKTQQKEEKLAQMVTSFRDMVIAAVRQMSAEKCQPTSSAKKEQKPCTDDCIGLMRRLETKEPQPSELMSTFLAMKQQQEQQQLPSKVNELKFLSRSMCHTRRRKSCT